MHRLIGGEIPAEQLFHYEDVLEHIWIPPTSSGMIRDTNHHVARVMFRSAAFPVAVKPSVLSKTRLTRN